MLYPAATRCGGSLGHPGWGSASKSFCQVSPGILFECDFFPAALVLQCACSGPRYASRLLSSCPRCQVSSVPIGSRHRQQWTLPASTTGFHCALSSWCACPYPRWCAVPLACSRALRWVRQWIAPASTMVGQRGVAQILYSVMRHHLWGFVWGVFVRGAFMPGYQCGGVCTGVSYGGRVAGALIRGCLRGLRYAVRVSAGVNTGGICAGGHCRGT